MNQYGDGTLELYAFHFAGSPLLKRIKEDQVEVVLNPADMLQRISDLENGRKRETPRFTMAT